jgi:hypothetical protein
VDGGAADKNVGGYENGKGVGVANNMKDLAKAFRRARVPIKRGQPKRRLRDAMDNEKGTGDSIETNPPPVFGEALDSWEPRYRPETEKELKRPVTRQPKTKEPEIQEKGPEIPQIEPDPDYEEETRTSRRMKRNKTRNMSLTISVSEEEHQLIRRHASSLGIGFSPWARSIIFRAMGRKVPARPKKD